MLIPLLAQGACAAHSVTVAQLVFGVHRLTRGRHRAVRADGQLRLGHIPDGAGHPGVLVHGHHCQRDLSLHLCVLVVGARKPLRHFCHFYAQFDRITPGSAQHLRILAGTDDGIPVAVHRNSAAREKVCIGGLAVRIRFQLFHFLRGLALKPAAKGIGLLRPAFFQAGHLCQRVVLPLLALGAGVGGGGHLAGAVRTDRKLQLVQRHPRQLAVRIQQHGSRHGVDVARTVCASRFGQNPQPSTPRRALRRAAARRGASAHRAGAAAGVSPAAAGQCQCCRQRAAQKPTRCLFHIVTYAPFPCLHCRRRLWS